jgi:hypothetical protein
LTSTVEDGLDVSEIHLELTEKTNQIDGSEIHLELTEKTNQLDPY